MTLCGTALIMAGFVAGNLAGGGQVYGSHHREGQCVGSAGRRPGGGGERGSRGQETTAEAQAYVTTCVQGGRHRDCAAVALSRPMRKAVDNAGSGQLRTGLQAYNIARAQELLCADVPAPPPACLPAACPFEQTMRLTSRRGADHQGAWKMTASQAAAAGSSTHPHQQLVAAAAGPTAAHTAAAPSATACFEAAQVLTAVQRVTTCPSHPCYTAARRSSSSSSLQTGRSCLSQRMQGYCRPMAAAGALTGAAAAARSSGRAVHRSGWCPAVLLLQEASSGMNTAVAAAGLHEQRLQEASSCYCRSCASSSRRMVLTATCFGGSRRRRSSGKV